MTIISIYRSHKIGQNPRGCLERKPIVKSKVCILYWSSLIHYYFMNIRQRDVLFVVSQYQVFINVLLSLKQVNFYDCEKKNKGKRPLIQISIRATLCKVL